LPNARRVPESVKSCRAAPRAPSSAQCPKGRRVSQRPRRSRRSTGRSCQEPSWSKATLRRVGDRRLPLLSSLPDATGIRGRSVGLGRQSSGSCGRSAGHRQHRARREQWEVSPCCGSAVGLTAISRCRLGLPARVAALAGSPPSFYTSARGNGRRRIVRGWPCEVDAASLRGPRRLPKSKGGSVDSELRPSGAKAQSLAGSPDPAVEAPCRYCVLPQLGRTTALAPYTPRSRRRTYRRCGGRPRGA
jgi:hypothetical protein